MKYFLSIFIILLIGAFKINAPGNNVSSKAPEIHSNFDSIDYYVFESKKNYDQIKNSTEVIEKNNHFNYNLSQKKNRLKKSVATEIKKITEEFNQPKYSVDSVYDTVRICMDKRRFISRMFNKDNCKQWGDSISLVKIDSIRIN